MATDTSTEVPGLPGEIKKRPYFLTSQAPAARALRDVLEGGDDPRTHAAHVAQLSREQESQSLHR